MEQQSQDSIGETAHIINGRKIADEILNKAADAAERFTHKHGRRPGLGTLLVGDDPASETYIRMKREMCARVGIESIHHTLPFTATQKTAEEKTRELAINEQVDGLLVQLPLPEPLNTDPIILSVPPDKDVDGFHPTNLGLLASRYPGVVPCTPAGIITLLDVYNVPLAGANAVVIGRSRIVGLPTALLLMERDATVTVAHKLTKNIGELTGSADIIVAAAGVPGLVTREMVKPGAVVIDVGTTRTAEGLRGDVDFNEVKEVASLISPVPGGVGPMTIAMLIQNTIALAYRRAEGRLSL